MNSANILEKKAITIHDKNIGGGGNTCMKNVLKANVFDFHVPHLIHY